MSLAVAPDGTAYVGANAITFMPSASSVQVTGGPTLGTYANGEWTTSVIDHDPTKNAPVTGVDIGANGEPLLWFRGTGPTGYSVASPSGASWSIADAAVPVAEYDGSNQKFARASDGSIVGLAYALTTSSRQLRALVGGTVVAVGSPVDFPAAPTFAYATGPSPSGAGPLFAVAVPHMDRIEVVAQFPNDIATSVSIPGGAGPSKTCPFPSVAQCSGSCHETSSGVEAGMFGLGWTDDGVAWLAYVVTHFDQKLAWSAQGDPGAPPEACGASITDASTGTLHIVRVSFDGSAPEEVLSIPVDRPETGEAWSADWEDPRVIDVRGVGKDLAIGIHTGWSGWIDPAVRVLRIDTSKL
jgi:hypothetical protein